MHFFIFTMRWVYRVSHVLACLIGLLYCWLISISDVIASYINAHGTSVRETTCRCVKERILAFLEMQLINSLLARK